jgi:hypothetical protein
MMVIDDDNDGLGLFCQASSDKAKSEGLSQLEECTF